MSSSTTKPRLIYDGHCEVCRRWVARWKIETQDRIEFVPFQAVSSRFPQISSDEFRRAVQFVDVDGHVYSGAEAVVRSLAHSPTRQWMVWVWNWLPGGSVAARCCYHLLARHRRVFGVVTTLLWGKDVRPSSYDLSRWLFLRLFGLVCLIAMGSMWKQIHGLVGSQGLLPAAEFMARVGEQGGAVPFLTWPTLCWFSTSDLFLHALCVIGVLLSLLLIVGVLPIVGLGLIWLIYLSLSVIGQIFFGFQWDVLLLETAFLAMFFAPREVRPRWFSRRSPPATGRWLLWLLLFKLMFLSGVTKLLSGDVSWWNLTALSVHYETQPIPNRASWTMHQLPSWFGEMGVLGMFVIELVLPILIFSPRRLRHAASAGLILLQILIATTGNYGFFNLLAMTLCITLLDDQLLWRILPRRWNVPSVERPCTLVNPRWASHLVLTVTVVLVMVSGLTMVREMVRSQQADRQPTVVGWFLDGCQRAILSWAQPYVLAKLDPFRTISGYGLFRVMTTERPEIVVEGSRNGLEWLQYGFRWKPSDLKRPPGFVAPHQPRLDWQMWFAALNPRGQRYWLQRFMQRLLEGSPHVLDLLQANPFPDQPPRYVRLVYYRYRFTDRKTREQTGAWWRRVRLGVLTQPMSLVGEAHQDAFRRKN